MTSFTVFLLAAVVAASPVRASNYQIVSSDGVNATKTLQLGAVLYPSLTALCSDAAVFAKMTNTSLSDGERSAADKKHAQTISALPTVKHSTKVFVVKMARVNCSGDPDNPSPVAFVRVAGGKYRDATGWILAEAIP
jgi:hypothetical protein